MNGILVIGSYQRLMTWVFGHTDGYGLSRVAFLFIIQWKYGQNWCAFDSYEKAKKKHEKAMSKTMTHRDMYSITWYSHWRYSPTPDIKASATNERSWSSYIDDHGSLLLTNNSVLTTIWSWPHGQLLRVVYLQTNRVIQYIPWGKPQRATKKIAAFYKGLQKDIHNPIRNTLKKGFVRRSSLAKSFSYGQALSQFGKWILALLIKALLFFSGHLGNPILRRNVCVSSECILIWYTYSSFSREQAPS